MRRQTTRTVRAVVAPALAALLAGGLVAGCSSGPSDGVADAARRGNSQNYVDGDGSVQQLPPDGRGAPLTLSGTTLDGKSWSMRDAEGKVLVVNVWGSWCQPCEAEAPHLVKAHEQLASRKDVAFLGIDVGEGPATGAAAAQRLGMTWPSLTDEDRAMGAALQNKADATPTTLVLDRQGRIAARVSGELTSPRTLTQLVEDVAGEHA